MEPVVQYGGPKTLTSTGPKLRAGHGKSVVSTARTMRETEAQIRNSGLFLIPKVSVIAGAEAKEGRYGA
jgi:hypothetical protein